MKRKLEINNREAEVDILSKSSDQISFLLNGKKHSFKLQSSQNGKAILTDKQNRNFTVYASKDLFDCSEGQFRIKKVQRSSNVQESSANGLLLSPLPGKVVKVLAKNGQKITEGDEILHLEAMKMEHRICADVSGVLKKLNVKEGDTVSDGQLLGEIE